jgi:phosphoribosylformimino-5-aminoimidazole carboxamide ribotide isomerase
VRLLKGDFNQVTVYSEDPVEVAKRHAQAGAQRIHVVDLDAARGTGNNRELVRQIVSTLALAVQVAGGIRTLADVESWLEIGTRWVVMGTTAVRRPDLLAECAQGHPGQILAALDLRAGRPSVTGWTADEEIPLADLIGRWEPISLAGIVVTSIDRDGTLEGPDLVSLDRVADLTTLPLIYSGGIGTLDDVQAVSASRAAGVILGKALYEDRFSLSAAIEAAG